jgi:hypothetical protein
VSRFSLENFTKKDAPAIPAWAQSRKLIEKLYHSVVKRAKEIEQLIEQSEADDVEKLKIKERKIVASQIADSLSIKRSNIRPDREPKLVDFIESENRRLRQFWKNHCSKLGVGQKLTKDDLEDLVKQKEKELEEAKQKNLHDYFDRAVESEVIHSQKDLADKYHQLQIDYQLEQEKSANLTKRVHELIREFNTKR